MRNRFHWLQVSALGLLSVLPLFGEGSCWLRDAASPGPMTAYALCQQGVLWVTSDGGTTWQSRNMDTTIPLRAMTFLDARRGVVVGEAGTVLGTDDGGMKWTTRESGTKEKLFDVSFAGENGWAAGMNGTIIATTDGGRTWKLQKTGTTQAIEGIYFLNANTGWAVGWAGTILRTSDGGANWQRINAAAAVWSTSAVYFKDEKNGWAVGFGGQLLASKDGGVQWSTVKTPLNVSLTSIAIDKAGAVWVTYDDGLLKSEDGGVTWKPIKTEGRYFLSRLFRVGDTLWAVGQSVILRQTGPSEWKRIDSLVPNTTMQSKSESK
jgi:photosystem II stability/assembly factor-like uncharacterized protein